MRLAFVDLVFAWPPPGGAQADLYHTMSGLQDLGHEVRLFAPSFEHVWRFGAFDPDALPFPATRIDFSRRQYNRREVPERFRQEVDAWKPDVVFICFGRFLKPYVVEALAHYPTVARYYMYEPLCLRDFCMFEKKNTCETDYLRSPNRCRRCALRCWKREIKQGEWTGYCREFLVSRAYAPDYYQVSLRALASLNAAIVNNDIIKSRLEPFFRNVRFIPGGFNVGEVSPKQDVQKGAGDRKIILMTGRADDYLKGLTTLVKAGRALSKVRSDFEVWVTHNDPTITYPWFKNIGWHDHAGIMELYQQADICVVPSLWDEPFGLVAVEAMAAGLPVCASRVGGLQTIVRHGETGFLFDRKDSAQLALFLERLLSDPEERARMGQAGRTRAEAEYDWKRIVPRYYPDFLKEVVA